MFQAPRPRISRLQAPAQNRINDEVYDMFGYVLVKDQVIDIRVQLRLHLFLLKKIGCAKSADHDAWDRNYAELKYLHKMTGRDRLLPGFVHALCRALHHSCHYDWYAKNLT